MGFSASLPGLAVTPNTTQYPDTDLTAQQLTPDAHLFLLLGIKSEQIWGPRSRTGVRPKSIPPADQWEHVPSISNDDDDGGEL